MSNQRQSRHKRRPEPGQIMIQERDVRILRLLADYRLLTTSQLHGMCFGARSKALRRLRQMYDAGLIDRIHRPVIRGSSEIVYILTKKGHGLLQQSGRHSDADRFSEFKSVSKETSLFFLDHELALVVFRLAMEKECRDTQTEILFWKSDQDLRVSRDGKRRILRVQAYDGDTLPLLPDAFFGIQNTKGKSYYFIEMDMGTESLKRVERKFRAYTAYLISGEFQRMWGFKAFRVLILTSSEKRRDNLIQLAGNQRRHAILFWFATFNKDCCGLFNPVWQCATHPGESRSILQSS